MKTKTPTILVIVGISGDLAKRKLLPAIGKIAAAGVLPHDFRIVGITRRSDVDIDQLLSSAGADAEYLRSHIELFQMSLSDEKAYSGLGELLSRIEQKIGDGAQRIFYLAVPPQVARPIIEMLGVSGLARSGRTKLLIEKPFGVDLESAKELVDHIDRYFTPEQVYRVDHYLAKETAQNLLVFRDDNSLFKRTWNKEFIERIEIIASEKIGIESRTIFYEQTGALRDIVQSHLLQLAALVLMETPEHDNLSEVPQLRRKALSHLALPSSAPIHANVTRGQYENYRKEVENPKSTVETFVSLTLASSDPRWVGVPITLVTGKALESKFTTIHVYYKKDQGHEANELILRLQPDEGVELCVWAKQPGYEHKVSRHALRFTFKEHYAIFPEPYEQVLFNAMNSDHSLFASSDEVLETWRILDPIQHAWEMSDKDLVFYKEGSAVYAVTALT